MRPVVPEGYVVRYDHSRYMKFNEQHELVRQPKGGSTRACLHLVREDGTIGEPVVEGFAWCAPTDNFNRKIGRDIALGRALKLLNHE